MIGQPTITRETVLWAARETVRMHTEGPSKWRRTGQCAQCPEQLRRRCPQLSWARAILDQLDTPAARS